MIDDEEIYILDAGARYGIHPKFSRLKNMKYYGFDPDLSEIERLRIKYKSRPGLFFYNKALSNKKGKLTLNVLRHRGQSSVLRPDKESYWFKQIRKGEGEIITTESVDCTTIDNFVKSEKIKLDFIKTDTEGHDLDVLKGGNVTLNGVLGVRCEVNFTSPVKGGCTFSEIHEYLLSKKLFLVNLDYSGRGMPLSYLSDENKFGVLTGSEAVYLRNIDDILVSNKYNIYKAALFLFLNDASDVALFLLQESIKKGLKIPFNNSKLTNLLKYEFCHTSYPLKLFPGDRFIKAKEDYQELFGEPFPDLHNFYESELLNPT